MYLRNLTKAVFLSAVLSAAVLTTSVQASDESLCYDIANLAVKSHHAANVGAPLDALKDSIDKSQHSKSLKKLLTHSLYHSYNNKFMKPETYRNVAYLDCKRYLLEN
jgi:hypothetical protein